MTNWHSWMGRGCLRNAHALAWGLTFLGCQWGILCGQESVARISSRVARDLVEKSGKETVFVDVRSPLEFNQEHIPGAINVPLADIGKSTLPDAGTLVLYCSGVGCPASDAAAAKFLSQGSRTVRVLDGGLAAWKQRGYAVSPEAPAARLSQVLPVELAKRLGAENLGVVDVRPAVEFIAGHIPGAVNIPLEDLPQEYHALSGEKDWVICDRMSARSRKAAVMLLEKGLRAQDLVGGISVWAKDGYSVEVGFVTAKD